MTERAQDPIDGAAKAGLNEFWRVVSEEFPEAKTGDLAPDLDHRFGQLAERAVNAWVGENVIPARFPPGRHVRFTMSVERFPHFTVPAGATGVVRWDDDSGLWVRLDAPLEGAEEWDNEVHMDAHLTNGWAKVLVALEPYDPPRVGDRADLLTDEEADIVAGAIRRMDAQGHPGAHSGNLRYYSLSFVLGALDKAMDLLSPLGTVYAKTARAKVAGEKPGHCVGCDQPRYGVRPHWFREPGEEWDWALWCPECAAQAGHDGAWGASAGGGFEVVEAKPPFTVERYPEIVTGADVDRAVRDLLVDLTENLDGTATGDRAREILNALD